MIHGGEALANRLTELASRRAAKGWHAQLAYLTKSNRLRASTSAQFGPRNLIAWLRGPDTPGGRAPSATSQQKIREEYDHRQRENHRSTLTRALRNDGNGTVIEVHPDPEIEGQSRGQVRLQHLRWHDWDQILHHWARDDDAGLRKDWEEMAANLYPPGAYIFISHLGFHVAK